ncbi:MAG: hypothetical protein JXR41_00300 [Bacteroidales bacterium]|nr:hypothetical protein [Bacteroidales bacterium]MBN2761499.1 hypothetical protein [Bacteroidales bacterium]
MLSNDILIKYIDNPELLNSQSLKEIQLLTDQYPFFQTARLLEVKNHHAAGSSGFQSKLHFGAAYVADRKILYELIYPLETKTIRSEEKEKDETVTGKVEKEIKPTLKENIADIMATQLQIIDSLDPEAAELIPMISLDIEKEYGGLETEENIMSHENTGDEIIWLEGAETDHLVSVNQDEPSVLSVDKHEALIDLEEEDTVEQVSADIDLKTEQPAENEMHQEAGPDVPDIQQETEIPDKDETPSKSTLIDRFIETNPRIAPPVGPVPEIDVSAESVKEDEGFLTDTLAKIYVKQGYYSKAIFAYEKLMLKYPEKSTYFAAQIEEIKKIME